MYRPNGVIWTPKKSGLGHPGPLCGPPQRPVPLLLLPYLGYGAAQGWRPSQQLSLGDVDAADALFFLRFLAKKSIFRVFRPKNAPKQPKMVKKGVKRVKNRSKVIQTFIKSHTNT